MNRNGRRGENPAIKLTNRYIGATMRPFRNRQPRTPVRPVTPQQTQRADWVYKPPQFASRSDPVIDLPADGHQLRIRMMRYRHMVVDFAVNQIYFLEGVPFEVARIDCSGGTIHRHQFIKSTGEDLLDHELLIVIPQRKPFEVVDEWYDRSLHMMQYGWNDNFRRWDDDAGQ